METYLPDETYDRLIKALSTAFVQPCPMTGKLDASEIKMALGEIADIWPASIKSEAT